MPRLRVPLAVATLAPPALDLATRHPALDLPRYVTLRVLDQGATSCMQLW